MLTEEREDAVQAAVYSAWSGLPNPIKLDLFTNAKPRRVHSGHRLFEVGDVGDGLYLLKSGLLKVMLESPQGGEVIIAILVPGTIVGDLAIIDGLPRAATVIALLDSDLLFVERADFDRCALRHPELYRAIAKILSSRLRATNQAVAADAFLSVKGRMARTLLQIAKILGRSVGDREISFPDTISQRDLAAMSGITRETANRVLAEWARIGLVVKSAHCYLITDSERLALEIEKTDA
jgi:CRP/FNR family cyclic AMP-dependent transcriptional regulator